MERFEDERGTIEDFFGGAAVNVTRIHTKKEAVRGNHSHIDTTQWTLVLSGTLLMAHGLRRFQLSAGVRPCETPPGMPHAWKALEDTVCLVFSEGPRGEDYESDTYRLEEPLL
jgi:quercetin dioxygenase-like cupin family protein